MWIYKTMKSFNHTSIVRMLTLLLSLSLVSCIEEYNELPEQYSKPMVVITGEIISGETCTFYVTTTNGSSAAAGFIGKTYVNVEGSDKSKYMGKPVATGKFEVEVGELKPEVEYWLSVQTERGTFRSKAMKPLDAPDIVELSYDQPRPDKTVDIILSTSDPGEQLYLQWDYEECWEVRTPIVTNYVCVIWDEYRNGDMLHFFRYDPITIGHEINHGWLERQGEKILASNEDYGNGAIRGLCLYQHPNSDHRFMTRYRTLVRQKAISREEYQYQKVLQQQTNQMGGLFTPMPSELPSNIQTFNDTHVIGFVGVRGKVVERELYINYKDVDYQNLDISKAELIDPGKMGAYELVKLGYALAGIDQSGEHWTYHWCVDCRDSYWDGGASLERPSYWKDAE